MWKQGRADENPIVGFAEMPLAEGAAVLDLNLGTVKSRLAYGLAQLRQPVVEVRGHEKRDEADHLHEGCAEKRDHLLLLFAVGLVYTLRVLSRLDDLAAEPRRSE
jgi:hypothetical protein